MINKIYPFKALWSILALLPALLSGCMSLAGSNPLGLGTSWQEEVLLHDGRTMVVDRSLSYGGRHEIGQPAPIKKQTVSFKLPDSSKTVIWTSEYSEDIGRANFNLLAVHVLNDIPFIVATPNLCLSYNKWGRPNPPYVFFKFNGTGWQQISLKEFPTEFKTINIAIYLGGPDVAEMAGMGLVPAEKIQKANQELRQPEYQTILREPIKPEGNFGSSVTCEELIWYKCGWGAPGEFNRKYFEQTCK
ncbi:hypothetical protein [uncultured Desulfobulbus sp.]|uniref:hypothetical protein n=1 Tax=uncultured Desulfobulbus sp. TaxID=239745 RepID=UPI0029C8C78A|nr:hypothetical protein [uncultured Desulfobulbus sp.]